MYILTSKLPAHDQKLDMRKGAILTPRCQRDKTYFVDANKRRNSVNYP